MSTDFEPLSSTRFAAATTGATDTISALYSAFSTFVALPAVTTWTLGGTSAAFTMTHSDGYIIYFGQAGGIFQVYMDFDGSADLSSVKDITISTTDWQLHGWDDAIMLFNYDTSGATPIYEFGIHAGKIAIPLYGSDILSNEFTGVGLAAGLDPGHIIVNNVDHMISQDDTSGLEIHTAANTWEVCGMCHTSTPFTSALACTVGGRVEPRVLMLVRIPANNVYTGPVGYLKYIYQWYDDPPQGTLLLDTVNNKDMFFPGTSTVGSTTVYPIVHGFDPTAAP